MVPGLDPAFFLYNFLLGLVLVVSQSVESLGMSELVSLNHIIISVLAYIHSACRCFIGIGDLVRAARSLCFMMPEFLFLLSF